MADVAHQQPKREFRARDAFIIAFVFISPIIALYAVFGLVITAAGPVGWWGFVAVLAMQVVLASTLGVMVSRWPIQGGSFQWARRLVGPSYGFFTGWIYMWTFIIVLGSGAYFVAGLVPPLFDLEPFTVDQQLIVALLIVAFVTTLNALGPTALKIFTRASLVAEVVGSVGLATVLLIWHRNQPLSILTETGGAAPENYLWGGFFMAIAVIGYSFAGFESVCSMSEEFTDPARHIPKAMIGAVVAIGLVVLYSSLALVLAIPDLPAVILGQVAEPASDTIVANLGPGIAKPVIALIVIGFFAGMVVAHTSISRVMWAFARDGSLPASRFLVKLSGKHRYPVRALLTVGVLVALVMLLAFSDRIYTTLISASTAGFFLTMTLTVTALIRRMARGRFEYGPFNFGRLTPVVVGVAGTWVVFQVVNLMWPRAVDQPWYVTWAVPVGMSGIALLGLLVRATVRPTAQEMATSDEALTGTSPATASGADPQPAAAPTDDAGEGEPEEKTVAPVG